MYSPIDRKAIQRGHEVLFGENTLSDFKREKYKEAKTMYQNFCKKYKLGYEPKDADAWSLAWSETYNDMMGEATRGKLITRLEDWRKRETL